MAEEKKRINAFVPADLYEQVMSKGYTTITEAIIKGFERLLDNEQGTNTKDNVQKLNNGLVVSLQERIESLEEQLRVKDGNYQERIQDLKEQLKVKDQQLEKKDTQIENLTNTMQSQAINIHDILNQKTIEAPGQKKPWYKFW